MIFYLLTYFTTNATLCYKMNAPFLIDNSWEMASKNFSYIETHIVMDLRDKKCVERK